MTSKSIASLSHNECCGCKACGDVCSKNAITFALDKEGFFYPSVNDDCIDCGLCAKVCPAMNTFDGCDASEQGFVGCLDKDKNRRDSGSSGGIFGLLASEVILEGYEVYGAAFDEKLQLKHCIATTNDEIERLKKSKYLQSDCNGIYRKIKQKVKDGHRLMFVGTPCQCAALKHYLGQLSSNVVIVDFACHGVPSQDLFDRCIHYYEKKNNCKVIGYSFRHKFKDGSSRNYQLTYKKNGRIMQEQKAYYKEPFYCGFQKYITLRPSCYHCKFARPERLSDITLADFWGIEQVTKNWDRTDNPSLVILNSQKGRQLFEKIIPDIEYFETTQEKAIKNNGTLKGPTSKNIERDTFFADLILYPFDEVVEKHLRLKRAWMKGAYYAIPFSIRKIMLNIFKKL